MVGMVGGLRPNVQSHWSGDAGKRRAQARQRSWRARSMVGRLTGLVTPASRPSASLRSRRDGLTAGLDPGLSVVGEGGPDVGGPAAGVDAVAPGPAGVSEGGERLVEGGAGLVAV